MKTLHSLLAGVLLIFLCMSFTALTAANLTPSPALQGILDGVVTDTLKQFGQRGLKAEQLAVTVVDLNATNGPTSASYRGSERIYPASVVKLFYLLAAHQWMEEGKLKDTGELRRAMKDMIVESSNDATGYIVDLLTETTSGPELSPEELMKWQEKRNAVNRYLAKLGFENINVNRKPWGDGPYGRETQSIKVSAPNHRNWLTTEATARLMTEIVQGKAVSARRSAEMRELLQRDPASKADHQAQFTGVAFPTDVKLWSKAGWTSVSRHDACYVEFPDGRKFVLVVFTEGHPNVAEIIPNLAKNLAQQLPHQVELAAELSLTKTKVTSLRDVRILATITNKGPGEELVNSTELGYDRWNLQVSAPEGIKLGLLPCDLALMRQQSQYVPLKPGQKMVYTYSLGGFNGTDQPGLYKIRMKTMPSNEVTVEVVPSKAE